MVATSKMTLDEVASAFGVERDAIYQALKRGQLRATKIGAGLCFDPKDVDAAIRAAKAAPRRARGSPKRT